MPDRNEQSYDSHVPKERICCVWKLDPSMPFSAYFSFAL